MDRHQPRVLEPLLLGALGALLSLFLFYPGFMSDDSVVQLMQARNETYSNVQPPLMSIIWHHIDLVLKGPTGMLILQNYLYWTGLALILLPFRGRAWLYFPLLAIVGFFPPSFLLQGPIWKDNLMSGFTLVSLGLYVVAALNREAGGGKRYVALGAALIAAWLAAMMRHNGVFAIFPILYLIASELLGDEELMRHRRREWRPIGMAIVATVGLFFGSAAIGDALATQHIKLKQLVLVFDMVGVAARTGEPIFDEAKYPELKASFIGPYSNAAAVKETYDPCDAFPVFVSHPQWGVALWTLTANEAVVSQASSAWMDAVRKHPGDFMRHKFDVFVCSLGIGTMGPWYASTFWEVPPKAAGLGVSTSGLSVVQKYIADQSWYLSLSPLYKIWIYFAAAIVIAALSFFGSRPLDRLAFCLAVSGLMYQGGYLLIGITTEFRYYVWLIICAVLAVLVYIVPRLTGAGPKSSL